MVTEITGVGYTNVGQALPATPTGQSTSSSPDSAPAVVPGSNTHDTSASRTSDKLPTLGPQSASTLQVAGTFARAQEQRTQLNTAAASVHATNLTVQKAMGLLEQTHQGLSQIVKMWPPYPAGSSQREAILNQVSGLRKMVESLTFPSPESLKQVAQVIGGQTNSAGASGIQNVAATVKSGVSGLAALNPSSASDASVGQALSQVDALHTKLQDMSTTMWRDVTGYVAQAATPEVHSQGAGVGQQLAGLGGLGMGSNGKMLQQAAESK